MRRFAFLGGCISLIILANSALAAGPSAIKSPARVAYEEQLSQARAKIHQRAAAEAQQRAARLEARKRPVRRPHPLAVAIRRDEENSRHTLDEPYAAPLPLGSVR